MVAQVDTRNDGLGDLSVWKIETIRWLIWAAWLLGFLASVCAFVTLCGYWAGEQTLQRWTGEGTTPMALNTAASLLALGIAVMILAQAAVTDDRFCRVLKPRTHC